MTTGDEPSIGGDKRIDTSGVEPKLGGEAAILHLVEMLNHDDRKVRYRAALKLAESGDERVFDTLVDMLQDASGNFRLRARAAMALGQLGDERAVEPLIASMNIGGVEHALRALAAIGGDRSLDAIEEMLVNPSISTYALGRALSKVGSQRLTDFMVSLIENAATADDPDPSSRTASILSEMGRQNQVVEKLLPLLSHESGDVRRHAITALAQSKDERLVGPLIALLDDAQPDVIRRAVNLLGRLGDGRATPRLIECLDHPDSSIVEYTVRALGEIGDARAVEPLGKVLEQAFADSEVELLRLAGRALANIDDPRGFEILEKALCESDDRIVRYLVEAVLSSKNSVALGTVFFQHQAARVCEEAARTNYLKESRYPQVVEPLTALLQHHPNPRMRADIAGLLYYIADERAVEPLIAALGDQDDHVCGYVAVALGKIGDSRAVEPLIAALNEGNTREIKSNAAYSLGEIGDTRAVDPLIHALHNDTGDDEHYTMRVAKALGELGDRQAVEPLITILSQGRVVAQAAWSLGQLGDRRAVEPLTDLLNERTNRHWQTTEAIAKALGELGDERAVEALKDALYYADQHPYIHLFRTCKEALEQIGTPEALAAIEDLPFRDL